MSHQNMRTGFCNRKYSEGVPIYFEKIILSYLVDLLWYIFNTKIKLCKSNKRLINW